MAIEANPTHSELVLVTAPTRRDGEVTSKLLEAAGVQCVVCKTLPEIELNLRRGVGTLVLTDVALAAEPALHSLLEVLGEQPTWSNLPIIILCRDTFRSPASMRAMRAFSNVTLLDRPTSTRAMVSAVRAALRGRRWQYRIRDQLVELTRAEKALRESDQRKDEFLATLAHELRNPLAPIKTGLQLLQSPALSGEQFDRVRAMMERQLSHLVKLIDDLLDVSRIATGKVAIKRERLDLRQVIESAVETCRPLVDSAGHHLAVTLPDHEVAVIGDAVRLAQCVANVINNAAKYTPDRGAIEVDLTDEGRDTRIVVSDSGVGIPAAMLGHVFDMFAQIDRTLDRSQGGLGIGLSLVKRLVSLHGGSVAVTSPGVDRGSSFTIRLPRATKAVSPDGVGEPSRLPLPSRPLRVMVIDDNRDAADSLTLLLQGQGHQTKTEYSGVAALRDVGGFLPEAVFCDIGMPELDGLRVATELRQDARYASTLLVAVTGWGAADDVRRSQEAGFDFHLTKPASAEAVKAVLARL